MRMTGELSVLHVFVAVMTFYSGPIDNIAFCLIGLTGRDAPLSKEGWRTNLDVEEQTGSRRVLLGFLFSVSQMRLT